MTKLLVAVQPSLDEVHWSNFTILDPERLKHELTLEGNASKRLFSDIVRFSVGRTGKHEDGVPSREVLDAMHRVQYALFELMYGPTGQEATADLCNKSLGALALSTHPTLF